MAPSPLSHLPPPEGCSKSSAVDAILAEAMDLCALEQIAALNTAHLSDSSLPTDLEARFRKLKSFPGAGAGPNPKAAAAAALNSGKENVPRTLNRSETIPNPPPAAFKPDEAKESEKPYAGLEPKSGSGFSSSPSIPRKSPRESPSPPRQACCFGLSPRKGQRNKDKDLGSLVLDPELAEWMDNKKILADLKDQRKKLKKVVKEQQKVSREAAGMVRLAKHASARMTDTAIDEALSSDDELK